MYTEASRPESLFYGDVGLEIKGSRKEVSSRDNTVNNLSENYVLPMGGKVLNELLRQISRIVLVIARLLFDFKLCDCFVQLSLKIKIIQFFSSGRNLKLLRRSAQKTKQKTFYA